MSAVQKTVDIQTYEPQPQLPSLEKLTSHPTTLYASTLDREANPYRPVGISPELSGLSRNIRQMALVFGEQLLVNAGSAENKQKIVEALGVLKCQVVDDRVVDYHDLTNERSLLDSYPQELSSPPWSQASLHEAVINQNGEKITRRFVRLDGNFATAIADWQNHLSELGNDPLNTENVAAHTFLLQELHRLGEVTDTPFSIFIPLNESQGSDQKVSTIFTSQSTVVYQRAIHSQPRYPFNRDLHREVPNLTTKIVKKSRSVYRTSGTKNDLDDWVRDKMEQASTCIVHQHGYTGNVDTTVNTLDPFTSANSIDPDAILAVYSVMGSKDTAVEGAKFINPRHAGQQTIAAMGSMGLFHFMITQNKFLYHWGQSMGGMAQALDIAEILMVHQQNYLETLNLTNRFLKENQIRQDHYRQLIPRYIVDQLSIYQQILNDDLSTNFCSTYFTDQNQQVDAQQLLTGLENSPNLDPKQSADLFDLLIANYQQHLDSPNYSHPNESVNVLCRNLDSFLQEACFINDSNLVLNDFLSQGLPVLNLGGFSEAPCVNAKSATQLTEGFMGFAQDLAKVARNIGLPPEMIALASNPIALARAYFSRMKETGGDEAWLTHSESTSQKTANSEKQLAGIRAQGNGMLADNASADILIHTAAFTPRAIEAINHANQLYGIAIHDPILWATEITRYFQDNGFNGLVIYLAADHFMSTNIAFPYLISPLMGLQRHLGPNFTHLVKSLRDSHLLPAGVPALNPDGLPTKSGQQSLAAANLACRELGLNPNPIPQNLDTQVVSQLLNQANRANIDKYISQGDQISTRDLASYIANLASQRYSDTSSFATRVIAAETTNSSTLYQTIFEDIAFLRPDIVKKITEDKSILKPTLLRIKDQLIAELYAKFNECDPHNHTLEILTTSLSHCALGSSLPQVPDYQ